MGRPQADVPRLGQNRVKRLLLSTMALALSALSTVSAGSITYTNDPTQFSDTIDWCQFGACTNAFAYVDTPTPWVSTSGQLTGNVGLFYSADTLLAEQQGVSWPGDFSPGMGLLYNWPLSSSGYPIAITFDQLVYGVGVYVDPATSGAFDATLYLFNSVYNITSSYTWSIADGELGSGPGTALFIGVTSSAPDIYGVIFDVVDQYGNADFAIGQAGVQPVPEPAPALLVGGALLGLGLVLRRMRRGLLLGPTITGELVAHAADGGE